MENFENPFLNLLEKHIFPLEEMILKSVGGMKGVLKFELVCKRFQLGFVHPLMQRVNRLDFVTKNGFPGSKSRIDLQQIKAFIEKLSSDGIRELFLGEICRDEIEQNNQWIFEQKIPKMQLDKFEILLQSFAKSVEVLAFQSAFDESFVQVFAWQLRKMQNLKFLALEFSSAEDFDTEHWWLAVVPPSVKSFTLGGVHPLPKIFSANHFNFLAKYLQISKLVLLPAKSYEKTVWNFDQILSIFTEFRELNALKFRGSFASEVHSMFMENLDKFSGNFPKKLRCLEFFYEDKFQPGVYSSLEGLLTSSASTLECVSIGVLNEDQTQILQLLTNSLQRERSKLRRMQILVRGVEKMIKLERNENLINEQNTEFLIEILDKIPNLEVLDLSQLIFLPEFLKNLWTKCPDLKILAVSGFNLSPKMVNEFRANFRAILLPREKNQRLEIFLPDFPDAVIENPDGVFLFPTDCGVFTSVTQSFDHQSFADWYCWRGFEAISDRNSSANPTSLCFWNGFYNVFFDLWRETLQIQFRSAILSTRSVLEDFSESFYSELLYLQFYGNSNASSRLLSFENSCIHSFESRRNQKISRNSRFLGSKPERWSKNPQKFKQKWR